MRWKNSVLREKQECTMSLKPSKKSMASKHGKVFYRVLKIAWS